MRIVTYNVNGIKARLPRLLEWLDSAQPDIACLQELKAVSEGFPILDVRAAGYDAIWHGQRSWNGVAILVKGAQPVEVRRALPGDPDDEQDGERAQLAASHDSPLLDVGANLLLHRRGCLEGRTAATSGLCSTPCRTTSQRA